MTRISKLCSWGLAALCMSAGPVAAQVSLPSDNTAYGTTSAEFLLLGAGARGMALGGGFQALANDVSAMYYNPAGLAQITRPGAMVSTYSYVADTRYVWGGLALPFEGGAKAVGFQVGNFGFSNQPVYTVDNPDGDGTFYSVSETFAGITLAQNFSDRFSAGLTGKLVSDELGKTSASAWAVDFGTNFHANAGGRPLRASFTIQNLGSSLKAEGTALDVTVTRPAVAGQVDVPQEGQPADLTTKDWGLPVSFRVGLAVDMVAMEQRRVTLLGEFNQPNNTKPGFGFGAEVALMDLGKSGFSLSGRGSYTYQSANNLDITNAPFATTMSGAENRQGLAAGFGVNYKKNDVGLGVDWAWRSMGVLGGTNILSFSVNW